MGYWYQPISAALYQLSEYQLNQLNLWEQYLHSAWFLDSRISVLVVLTYQDLLATPTIWESVLQKANRSSKPFFYHHQTKMKRALAVEEKD